MEAKLLDLFYGRGENIEGLGRELRKMVRKHDNSCLIIRRDTYGFIAPILENVEMAMDDRLKAQ